MAQSREEPPEKPHAGLDLAWLPRLGPLPEIGFYSIQGFMDTGVEGDGRWDTRWLAGLLGIPGYLPRKGRDRVG